MHDIMKKSKDIEINHLNTTTKIKSDMDKDKDVVVSAIIEGKKTPEEEKKHKVLNDKILESPMLISPTEPKRKNQYIVKIDGLDVQPFVFQKVKRPIKYHGGWGNMEIKILDIIEEDIHTKLDTLLKKKKGFFGNGDWKLKITLEELDPNGNVISEWKYKTILSAIEYCDMEYGSSEILNFNLHLSVSDVKHNSY
jgi:hypothetical protein